MKSPTAATARTDERVPHILLRATVTRVEEERVPLTQSGGGSIGHYIDQYLADHVANGSSVSSISLDVDPEIVRDLYTPVEQA